VIFNATHLFQAAFSTAISLTAICSIAVKQGMKIYKTVPP